MSDPWPEILGVTPEEMADFRAKVAALPPITWLDLPDIVENLSNLYRTHNQEGLHTYVLLLAMRANDTKNVEDIMREVLDSMDDDTRAWWDKPCGLCDRTGMHIHN